MGSLMLLLCDFIGQVIANKKKPDILALCLKIEPCVLPTIVNALLQENIMSVRIIEN